MLRNSALPESLLSIYIYPVPPEFRCSVITLQLFNRRRRSRSNPLPGRGGSTMLAKGPASRFPVFKSRLEACGSSVPRPTTAPSAHPGKPKAMAAELSLSKAESSSKLEQEYIYNLQQQVYLQELELKYVKQQKASNTFDSSTSEPVDASLHNIKGSYKHMEADFAKRMHQEEDRHNELREEALRAVMHEKRAHAEKTKVVDQLARVREQFSSQRQELTAEVVGLQRELEKCFLTEKTLRTELEQASTQLKDIRVFSDGADAQACQGQGERERERARARAWGAPRRERGGAPKRSHSPDVWRVRRCA